MNLDSERRSERIANIPTIDYKVLNSTGEKISKVTASTSNSTETLHSGIHSNISSDNIHQDLVEQLNNLSLVSPVKALTSRSESSVGALSVSALQISTSSLSSDPQINISSHK